MGGGARVGQGTYERGSNGDYQNLPRAQPERPLPSEMLGDDRDEPLQASQNCPMDHDRSCWRLVGIRCLFRPTVFEVKPLWKLEIQLDGCTLERALQGVSDRDVYLWTVERSVTRVDLPFPRVVFLERFRELLFASTITFSTKLMRAQSRERILGCLQLCRNQQSVSGVGKNSGAKSGTGGCGEEVNDSRPQLHSKFRFGQGNCQAG